MSTTSTQNMIADIRTRLLTFEPATGSPLEDVLTALYTVQAPDNAVYPYAVMRLVDRRQSDGDQQLRETFEIEVQVFDRPRSQQWRAEGIADVIEQAFSRWDLRSSGLLFSRHIRRVTMPPAPSPMDRELVQITVFVPVAAWPVMLTQYVT